MAGKFTVSTGKDGKHYFALKAGNGEVILQSQGYASKASCANGIESVRKNSQDESRFEKKTASNGKFYTAQGTWLVELDPNVGEFTFNAAPSKQTSNYLCFTQGPDGTIWGGGTYATALVSLDPETHETQDHGRMDPKEKYLSFLAVDKAGWVYSGIGTARNAIGTRMLGTPNAGVDGSVTSSIEGSGSPPPEPEPPPEPGPEPLPPLLQEPASVASTAQVASPPTLVRRRRTELPRRRDRLAPAEP